MLATVKKRRIPHVEDIARPPNAPGAPPAEGPRPCRWGCAVESPLNSRVQPPPRAWRYASTPVGETFARCLALRRSPAAALWYALAILVVVGGLAVVVFLLGTPELALPSEWADARARIDDGSFPAGYIVDIVSGVLALAWAGGLWFLLAGVLNRRRTRAPTTRASTTRDIPITGAGSEPDDETDIPITGAGSEITGAGSEPTSPGTARAHRSSTSRSATSTRESSCRPMT